MTVPAPPPDFLTVAEAAAILQISKMSVYRRIEVGDLTAYRMGRSVRIDRQDLYTYLRRSRSGR